MEKEIRNKIINMYKANVSIEEIQNKYSINWSELYTALSPIFKYSLDSVNDLDKILIKDLYLSGMSSTKIAIRTGIYHKLINKILDEYGIKRTRNGIRKYTLNEKYFDVIDNQDKAYILGFLYADGSNSLEKCTISLSLQCYDKEILEKINTAVGSNRPLDFINNSKDRSDGYTYEDMYGLKWFSSHMCHSLDNIGMCPNKSLILKFPDCIQCDLLSHFIRGYFDGDGSYCHSYFEKYGNRDIVTLTSTESFCTTAKEMINKFSPITGGGIYDASCHNGITKVLSISGKNQVKNFLDWIYFDANLFMKRKHDLYIERFYC